MADPLDLVASAAASQYLTDAGLSTPADLAAIITGVSVSMQSYASRIFGSAAYAATLNGAGGDRVSLPNYPITAVASVTVDGVSIPAAPDAINAGYVFSDTQVLLRGYRFCRGVQNVGIGYTAGFATIPMDLQRACCEGVGTVVAAFQYNDPRVVELQAGGSRVKLGSMSARDYDKFCLTPNVTDVLDQVRRVVPC